MLTQYTPMAPTLVREPFHRDGWVYEEKVDGWRILAYKDGDRVRRLVSPERPRPHPPVSGPDLDRMRREPVPCSSNTPMWLKQGAKKGREVRMVAQGSPDAVSFPVIPHWSACSS